MRDYENSWVGDPERDAKGARNRALRELRIALANEHAAGLHDEDHDECAFCYTTFTQ